MALPNKSYNDLQNLQNMQSKNYYVFVFDFDMTLTLQSSDGMDKEACYTQYIKLFESDQKLFRLKEYFEQIVYMGFPIYINTRALSSDIIHIMEKVGINIGKPMLIKDVMGSNTTEQINIPFSDAEKSFYNITSIDNPDILWAIKKVIYLNKIREIENTNYNNILFFDDSEININMAKLNGYVNSFIIGANDSGLYGLDYLLIKLNQILDLI
jgi:hypothetical protein